jgi:hypothetical protein
VDRRGQAAPSEKRQIVDRLLIRVHPIRARWLKPLDPMDLEWLCEGYGALFSASEGHSRFLRRLRPWRLEIHRRGC